MYSSGHFEGITVHWNIQNYTPNNTASHHRRNESSSKYCYHINLN